MSSSDTQKRMERDLDALREQSQFRTLEVPAGVNLSSNDYLGLALDPRLKQAVLEAVAQSGSVGSTGSRLLSGNSPEWEELESTFAEFAGTEAALYFGSGYAANIGMLSSLLKPGDLVFSDALNHASLIDGIRLSAAKKIIYPHCDVKFLENALREHAGAPGSKLIVTESLFSMEGDIAPLAEMLDLACKYGAALVIDEAHATGVCGPHGRGIAAELGIERDILGIVHTCGKALASAGAFVCGRKILKDYLINRARTFIFSTAMPPYLAGQIGAALKLARDAETERNQLREIASVLREGLTAAGINCGTSAAHIVPVILGTNEMALRVARELRRRGFAAKAIRPPSVPPGTARIRVSLTSRTAMSDIRRLIAVTVATVESMPRESSATSVHA
ncbi:MAG TPA: 8-amino-7-oxononanoate synthase [Candidatus Acidoferrum sp.]|nr:8-amino-7-oxononanoate synthase [Candidatus Acidoferrum sp.]